jgi:hypothetical protein
MLSTVLWLVGDNTNKGEKLKTGGGILRIKNPALNRAGFSV